MSGLEEQIAAAAREAIGASIAKTLVAYDSPLNKLVSQVVESKTTALEHAVSAGFDAVMSADGFQAEVETAIRQKLARTLVSKIGGEIEKRINDLRSNPATRARVTLALEKMISEVAGDE